MLEHADYPWYWEYIFAFHTHRFIHPHHLPKYEPLLRSIYEQLFATPVISDAKKSLLSATDQTYTFDTYLSMNSTDVEHIIATLQAMSDDTFTNVVMSYGNQYSGHNCLWWNPYLRMDDYVRIIAVIEERARTLLYDKRRIYYTTVYYEHKLSELQPGVFYIRDVYIKEAIDIVEANHTLRNTMRHIYECLTIHTNIRFSDVANHIRKPWFWVCLWSRSVVDWDFVESCIASRDTVGYVKFVSLSRNKSLPWEFVIRHLEYPWIWSHIVSNPCFTMDTLRRSIVCTCGEDSSPNLPCLCYLRDASSCVDVATISEGYMQLDIRGMDGRVRQVKVARSSLLDNPNIAPYFRNVRWNDMIRLFSNIGFQVGMLPQRSDRGSERFSAYGMQRSVISSNPNISGDIVRRYSHVPWDWAGLSLNPSLSFDFLSENSDRLEWVHLSGNHFHLSDSYKEHRRWKGDLIRALRVRTAKRILLRSVLLPYLEWYYNPSNPRMMERCRGEYEILTRDL